MDVHPLTLMTLSYSNDNIVKANELLTQVREELDQILNMSGDK